MKARLFAAVLALAACGDKRGDADRDAGDASTAPPQIEVTASWSKPDRPGVLVLEVRARAGTRVVLPRHPTIGNPGGGGGKITLREAELGDADHVTLEVTRGADKQTVDVPLPPGESVEGKVRVEPVEGRDDDAHAWVRDAAAPGAGWIRTGCAGLMVSGPEGTQVELLEETRTLGGQLPALVPFPLFEVFPDLPVKLVELSNEDTDGEVEGRALRLRAHRRRGPVTEMVLATKLALRRLRLPMVVALDGIRTRPLGLPGTTDTKPEDVLLVTTSGGVFGKTGPVREIDYVAYPVDGASHPDTPCPAVNLDTHQPTQISVTRIDETWKIADARTGKVALEKEFPGKHPGCPTAGVASALAGRADVEDVGRWLRAFAPGPRR